MSEEFMWDMAELFAQIDDGMRREFVIYGYTVSFMDIFIWGTLGTILIEFLRGLITRD